MTKIKFSSIQGESPVYRVANSNHDEKVVGLNLVSSNTRCKWCQSNAKIDFCIQSRILFKVHITHNIFAHNIAIKRYCFPQNIVMTFQNIYNCQKIIFFQIHRGKKYWMTNVFLNFYCNIFLSQYCAQNCL